MAKIYFTLTGTKYYHGHDFLKPGMKVTLKKEPDNPYDKEAILVKLNALGDIGHVANSPYTVLGESISAGRLYDKIGKKAEAKVVLVTPHGTICKVCKKSLIGMEVMGARKAAGWMKMPDYDIIMSEAEDDEEEEEDDE